MSNVLLSTHGVKISEAVLRMLSRPTTDLLLTKIYSRRSNPTGAAFGPG